MNYTNITNSILRLTGGSFYVESSTLRNISLHQINIVNSTTINTGGVFHIKIMAGHLNISSDIDKTNLISVFDA